MLIHGVDMRLRHTIALIFLSLVGSAGLYAHAVGLQLDVAPDTSGAGYGPALTFKINGLDPVFAVNLAIRGNDFSLGITGDEWLYHETITPDLPLLWGYGIGGYVHMGFSGDSSVSMGVRFPLFLDAYFREGTLEPFIQIAPSVGIVVAPEFRLPDWSIPFSIGLRYWFNEP